MKALLGHNVQRILDRIFHQAMTVITEQTDTDYDQSMAILSRRSWEAKADRVAP